MDHDQFFGGGFAGGFGGVDSLPGGTVRNDLAGRGNDDGLMITRDFQLSLPAGIFLRPHRAQRGGQFAPAFLSHGISLAVLGGRGPGEEQRGAKKQNGNGQWRAPGGGSLNARGNHLERSTSGINSEMCLMKCAFIFFRTSAGTSFQSPRFWSGRITCFTPKRAAASTFSLMPPTRRTRPRRLISPVMATSERTRRCINNEARAATMVTPALGPSLGVAPAGT